MILPMIILVSRQTAIPHMALTLQDLSPRQMAVIILRIANGIYYVFHGIRLQNGSGLISMDHFGLKHRWILLQQFSIMIRWYIGALALLPVEQVISSNSVLH